MRSNLENNIARSQVHYGLKFGSTTQVLSGPFTIPEDGPIAYFFDAGGVARNVFLPEIQPGGSFFLAIVNDGAEDLNILDSGGVAQTTIAAGVVVTFYSSASAWFWSSSASGASDFLSLTDTPASYVGAALQVVRVNAGETALEFASVSGTGDVVGPAASTDGSLARFDGTTGKLLKDGAVIGVDVQAFDSDLASIAALATTAYGRGLLTLADATALAGEVDAFFLTPAEGNAAYQPLDGDLTSIAALTTTAYGRGLLTLANATALAAEVDSFFLTPTEGNAAYQPLDADLTSWAAITRATGFDTWATTPSSANLASLLTDKTGTGVNVFGTAPTFTTSITSTLIYGGSAAGSTLTLQSTSSGAPSGDSIVWKTGGATRATMLSSGFLSIGADTTPTVLFQVSSNSASNIPTWAGTTLQAAFVAADSAGSGVAIYAPGTGTGGAGLFFYASLGTAATPLRTKSGNPIGAFGGRGAYAADDVTTASFVTTSKVNTVYFASEDWTSTAQGTFMEFYTTATGTTTRSAMARMQPSGGFSVGIGQIATDPGEGVISAGHFFTSIEGFKRVGTQFDKTSDTTLANVTDLSSTLVAGQKYRFRAVLHITSGASGGAKAAIAGTATATSINYTVKVMTASAIALTNATALGTAGGTTAVVLAIEIEGNIVVNAAGTLTVQFAQNASNATTSSVLINSSFTVYKVA